MSIELRIALIVFSVLGLYFCITRIRRSAMKIDDVLFWAVLSGLILLLSLFPGIAIAFSEKLGIESPANFVFLIMIFLLLYKVFMQTLTISKLEIKLEKLAREYALSSYNKKDEEEE